ncbi:hypothetical protein HDU67_006117 [Dinochytrium kinnereticum]|nr:hypothetical protein HDU67_006117 [Dinochytrium kinnereticum]
MKRLVASFSKQSVEAADHGDSDDSPSLKASASPSSRESLESASLEYQECWEKAVVENFEPMILTPRGYAPDHTVVPDNDVRIRNIDFPEPPDLSREDSVSSTSSSSDNHSLESDGTPEIPEAIPGTATFLREARRPDGTELVENKDIQSIDSGSQTPEETSLKIMRILQRPDSRALNASPRSSFSRLVLPVPKPDHVVTSATPTCEVPLPASPSNLVPPENFTISPKQPKTLRILAVLRHWEAGRMARWWAWRDSILLAAIREEEVKKETRRRFLSRLRTHPWVDNEPLSSPGGSSAASESGSSQGLSSISPVTPVAEQALPAGRLAIPVRESQSEAPQVRRSPHTDIHADIDSELSLTGFRQPDGLASPLVNSTSNIPPSSQPSDISTPKSSPLAIRAMAVERLRAARGGRERDRSAQVLLRVGDDHGPPSDEIQPFEKHRTAMVGRHAGALPIAARGRALVRGFPETGGSVGEALMRNRELAARIKLFESRRRVRNEVDSLVQRANLRIEAFQAKPPSNAQQMISERQSSPPRNRPPLTSSSNGSIRSKSTRAGKRSHPLALGYNSDTTEDGVTEKARALSGGVGSIRFKFCGKGGPKGELNNESSGSGGESRNRRRSSSLSDGQPTRNSGEGYSAPQRSASVDRKNVGAGRPASGGASAPFEVLLTLRRRMLAQQKALNSYPPEDAVVDVEEEAVGTVEVMAASDSQAKRKPLHRRSGEDKIPITILPSPNRSEACPLQVEGLRRRKRRGSRSSDVSTDETGGPTTLAVSAEKGDRESRETEPGDQECEDGRKETMAAAPAATA